MPAAFHEISCSDTKSGRQRHRHANIHLAAVKLPRGEVASVSSLLACGEDEMLVSARGKSHPKPTDFPLASMPPDVLQTPEGAGALQFRGPLQATAGGGTLYGQIGP